MLRLFLPSSSRPGNVLSVAVVMLNEYNHNFRYKEESND